MRAWAIILAAGEGRRVAQATQGTAKQFLLWQGMPLYWHSARTFSRCARIAGLVFVFPPAQLAAESTRLDALDAAHALALPWCAVAGGALRQDSVHLGLRALPTVQQTDAGHVLIHDAARPFVTPDLINRVLDALEAGAEGVIPGLPVTDTIKTIAHDHVASTPERASLVAVQTPQGFCRPGIDTAHAQAQQEQWIVTDDAALLERCGQAVRVIPGEPGNSKITTPEDLAMLHVPQTVPIPCVGWGYDVHRYAEVDAPQSRPMRLGGVLIPKAPAVAAHSDGDVLLHALADAMLGCFAGGDIGQLFPDTDPALDNMHSAIIVDEVLQRLHQRGLSLSHVDMTVIAQTPRIAPHREAIRTSVARLLSLRLDAVSLKATTEEGLGFTGEKRGIKATAVVTALRQHGCTQMQGDTTAGACCRQQADMSEITPPVDKV